MAKQLTIRKRIKKENLADAKKHFPYRYEVLNHTPAEIKQWMMENRFRSWKQKGLNGDYYTMNHKILWFREEESLLYFILSFT